MAIARSGGSSERDLAFDHAWSLADGIGGWLTPGQARVLWDAAWDLQPGSTIVEIGSHQGRSTVILGLAAQRTRSRVVAIDPFVEGAMFGGSRTRGIFEANINAAALEATVELHPVKSSEARRTWDARIDLLYIDGKHDYWTVVDDLEWSHFLAPDARVFIHDSFCSVGVTSALLDRVLMRGRLRYVGRESTLAVFDQAPPDWSDRRRVLRQMPWFSRNLIIKAARRTHATPVLRAMKHDSPVDPY